MLDALVKSAAKDKPGLLAAWNMAKRVPKKGVASSATATTAPVPASPATPAVAAPQSASATSVAA